MNTAQITTKRQRKCVRALDGDPEDGGDGEDDADPVLPNNTDRQEQQLAA